MSGTMDVVIAAGVESMTRVPMGCPSVLAQKAGLGYYQSPSINQRYQNQVFSQFMGAETVARKYGLDKQALDAYALQSHRRAAAAAGQGWFKDEILPIAVRDGEGAETGEMHTADEGIRFDATLDGIQGVKLLQEGGVITAANASQICDGASGVLVANAQGLKKLGVEPLARVAHMSVLGHDPVIMLEAPIPATRTAWRRGRRRRGCSRHSGTFAMRAELASRSSAKAMSVGRLKVCWSEPVYEAFASIPLAWLQALGADAQRMNVHGGAIALGHPLGASGTKLMTTLVHALRQHGKRWGLQTMCEGGGMANVTLIELL